jgi:pyruvate kinase
MTTMQCERHAKIVATLGSARAGTETMRPPFLAGVAVFRVNSSHGAHEQHQERLVQIPRTEQVVGRPTGVPPRRRIRRFGPSRELIECGDSPIMRPSMPRGRGGGVAPAALHKGEFR